MTNVTTKTGGIQMNVRISGIPFSQIVFIGFGVIFLGCLLIQFLLAGMAIFEDATKWATHKEFVHVFGYTIPVMMIVSSVTGKFFSRVYKELSAIFLLIFMMYLTGNVGWQVGLLGAFHPVAGVFLIVAACVVVMKVYKGVDATEDVKSKYEKGERSLFSWAVIGVVGGFIGGLLLSTIIGIIGFLLFEKQLGIKFLPFYLAFISSILVPVWMYKKRRG